MEQKKKHILDKATELATMAHSGMTRKIDGKPYILHPMEVMSIAGTITQDENVLAAAVLHDTVEDTDLTLDKIREACGDRVAELVEEETEDKRNDVSPKDTWKVRKQETLDRLRGSKDRDVKILWLSDKLSNMRSLVNLWNERGADVWKNFHETDPAEQAWYYRSVAALTEELKDTKAWAEYSELVNQLFGKQKAVEAKTENGKLIISLSGKIDSANAPEILADVDKALKENPADTVVLDCDQLMYTTSAGLRVILHLKQEVENTSIIHAHPDLYNVLEMTGFTDMMEVHKAYRVISVKDCEVIGQGANGKVYRIDPDTIVKVYLNPDALPEIHRERELARTAFVAGVPTAIPYDVVQIEGGGYGSVFERLSATSFAKLLTSGEKTVDELAEMSDKLLKLIHSKTVDEGSMPDMKAVALDWADFLKDYLEPKLYKKLHDLVDAVPKDLHMMHGDYHLKNVMLQDGETLLIDMDTLSFGNPVFELASMYNAYEGYSALDHSIVESFLGIPADTASAFWKKSLELYLGTTDKKKLKEVEDKAKIIGYTRIMRRTIRRNGLKTKDGKAVIENCKKVLSELVPKTDTLLF